MVPRFFFIVRISIQGQTHRETDMIFPGVGHITSPYYFLLPACSFRIYTFHSSFNNSSASVSSRDHAILFENKGGLSINCTLIITWIVFIFITVAITNHIHIDIEDSVTTLLWNWCFAMRRTNIKENLARRESGRLGGLIKDGIYQKRYT